MKGSERKIIAVSILAIAFLFMATRFQDLRSHRCLDTEYEQLPYIGSNQYKDYYAMPAVCQKNALKAISAMLMRCPHASYYVVEWSYAGRSFGGTAFGTTIFHRKKGILQHTPGIAYSQIQQSTHGWHDYEVKDLKNVSSADIHAVAKVNGTLVTLQKRLIRKHNRGKSN